MGLVIPFRRESMWLSGLRLVLPDQTLTCGSLRIEEGQIVEVVEGGGGSPEACGQGPPPQGGVSCRGLTALPGLVDLHGDMLEREIEPRPRVYFPTELAIHELDKRLACSGVTTAYTALCLNWNPPRSTRDHTHTHEMIVVLNQMRDTLLVDHRIHGRFEYTLPVGMDTLEELLAGGQLHLLSLMDHTPGQGQFRDVERYIQYTMGANGVDRASVEREVRERREQANDAEAWERAAWAAHAARECGLAVASHDDDSEERVAWLAENQGSISEFPVNLEAARAAKQRGLCVAMGAPNVLRGRSMSGNLSALDAINEGVVDALASDYHPGAMLQVVFQLARQGIMPLHQAVRLVSDHPAQAAGLTDRGRLQPGYLADLVLVEEASCVRVRATFRAGIPIYSDGSIALT